MFTELFIRYFFPSKEKKMPEDQTFTPSEDRLEFLNIVVWVLLGAIALWLCVRNFL